VSGVERGGDGGDGSAARADQACGRKGVVIGLLGPTGVGKTNVAVEIALRLGIGIISCDSMQVYSGFPVLTNQPAAKDLDKVRHELIGIIDPGRSFSAAEYAELARPLIKADLAERGVALVVGGTGLYMRGALAPLAVAPAANLELRRQLESRAEVEGAAVLHSELAQRDPAAAQAIDPRNVRRVIRALEVINRTGSAWSGRNDLWRPRYFHRTLLIGLSIEREELYRRIDTRARLIVEGEGLEEVRRYRLAKSAAQAAGSPAACPIGIEAAIGYAEIGRCLDGLQSLEETVDQVATATRRYARRQLTWLRKLDDLVRIDVQATNPAEVAQTILELVTTGEHVKEPQST
jgi:tRNA dimethylallyltransferase